MRNVCGIPDKAIAFRLTNTTGTALARPAREQCPFPLRSHGLPHLPRTPPCLEAPKSPLLVLLAPPALKLSVNETLVVNPGENVTVQCLLTGGDPLPQLQWSHGPGPLPLGALAQGGALSIPSVQARDSGYYNCTATNNVGNPAKKTVNLLVRCTWLQGWVGTWGRTVFLPVRATN